MRNWQYGAILGAGCAAIVGLRSPIARSKCGSYVWYFTRSELVLEDAPPEVDTADTAGTPWDSAEAWASEEAQWPDTAYLGDEMPDFIELYGVGLDLGLEKTSSETARVTRTSAAP